MLMSEKMLTDMLFQLTPDDYLSMAELLPYLEQISQQHPEPVIQELASDLRATIATHGAYHPKTVLKTAGQHNTAHSPAQPADHSSNSLPATTSASRAPSTSQIPSQPVSHPKNKPNPGAKPKVKDFPGISPSKAFSECLLEACDPDVPTRAVAVRSLTRSFRDGDREALQNKDKLLMVSGIYLYVYMLV